MQKKRWFVLAGVVAALVSLALLVAACGDDEDEDGDGGPPPATEEPADGVTDGGGTIDVSVNEFSVNPSVGTIASGSVTFNVSNDGAILHNFLVIRSDLDPDALPVDESTSAVDEEQVEVLATSSDLGAGESEAVTVDLEAGSYVLICNIPTHYTAGTFIGFTVE